MKNIVRIIVPSLIAAMLVATIASAGPGLGIAIDTHSLKGTGSDGNRLGLRTDCASGEIMKWSGSVWACSGDLGGLVTGDIDGITTPSTAGITGGCVSGTCILTLLTTCTSGQILKWDGTTWACAADSDSGDITAVTAGTGISGGGTSGAVTVTANLAGASCSAGNYVSALTSTGAGTCTAEVGDISSVGATSNMGLTGGATSGAATLGLLSTCANGQVLKSGSSGTTWTCANDDVTAVSGSTNSIAKFTSPTAVGNSTITDDGTNIAVNTNKFTVVVASGNTAIAGTANVVGALSENGARVLSAVGSGLTKTSATVGLLSTCADGQVLKSGSSGATWTCANDSGGGGITNSASANYYGKSDGTNIVNGVTKDDGTNWTINTTAGGTTAKFTVVEASGNTTIAGTLGVTGAATMSSGLTSTGGQTLVGNLSGQRITGSITANVDDWAPSGIGTAMVVDVTSVTSGPFVITGITSSGSTAGRILTLLNNGGNTFLVTNESGSSSAGNKIKTTNAVTRWIANYGSITFVWDGTTWDQIAESSLVTPEVYDVGALYVGAASTLIGSVSTYGNTTLGDAAGDTVSVVGTASFSVESTHPSVRTAKVATKSSCTAPTLTCGTSPSITGCDLAGTVTIGTGSPATCVITFANAFTNVPTCVVSAQNGTAKSYASATGNVTITSPVSSTKYDYICMEH